MSKMDDMRAMREAKFARRVAGAAPALRLVPAAKAPADPAATAAPVSPPAPAAPVEAGLEAPLVAVADPAPEEELCGHRNMGGRTCTRERGHAAKSHRYA